MLGDAKYIVQDLGNIVPPRNAQALVDAILAYTQKSEAEKQSLKLATRERVEQNFSIETVSRQYMQVWSQGHEVFNDQQFFAICTQFSWQVIRSDFCARL
jgi:glycosyltransferase involved in cell wall biosynthesis